MKKNIVGILFLLLAVTILIGGFWWKDFQITIWLWAWVAFTAYVAIKHLLQRDFIVTGIFGLLCIFALNSTYRFLPIENSVLILTTICAVIGLNILFKPQKWQKRLRKRSFQEASSGNHVEVSFGSTTKYISDDAFREGSADVSFGDATVYLDNANIIENRAQFVVDVSFGNLTLYIPRIWCVDLRVDNSFGAVDYRPVDGVFEKTLLVTGDVSFGHLEIIYI
ncbi:hypothetical protein [Streptococcus himalayensis]|uniref:Cell wall-active antibiotics response LiaF-like C-terminal domain-containing protein n=1 Tax=Streptococcus himalayensis TaxID=1888195 RepID=A0A917A962_9STRE|nr:hypothetical protein [Streptococcus himalayensis]GGE36107.1 hypothetical protein GCM10011510_16800 [Streptococcus himalayensis]